jgi:autotransporter-associated beta strand protein
MVSVGSSNLGSYQVVNSTQTLKLGAGTNTLFTDSISLGTGGNPYGGGRGVGVIQFNGAGGVLILRDLAGGGGPDISFQPGGSTGNGYGTMDLTGHYCDVKVRTLAMGDSTTTTARTHNFSFNHGLLDIHTVNLGVKQNSSTYPQTCNLNLGGGIVSLGSDDPEDPGSVSLATGANGFLNITGGTVTLVNDIIRKSGSGAATLNLSGTAAVLDLNGHNVGDLSYPIDSFNFSAGTLRNLGTVFGNVTLAGSGARLFEQNTAGVIRGILSGGVGLIKAGTNGLTLSGPNTYSGGTIVSNGTLIASGTGVLGSGNLTVLSDATCALQNPVSAIADSADVQLSGTLDLAAGVNEAVARLFIDGVEMPGGIWNSGRDPVHFSGTGNLIVANSGVIPVPPQLMGAQVNATQFQFQVHGPAGYHYTVQASTNLADWTDLLSTNPSALPFHWADGDAAVLPGRFYRVVRGP